MDSLYLVYLQHPAGVNLGGLADLKGEIVRSELDVPHGAWVRARVSVRARVRVRTRVGVRVRVRARVRVRVRMRVG